MAEPEDLLGKADALMARHRPGRSAGAAYAEIPVLDEVVYLPGDDPLLLSETAAPDRGESEQLQALAAGMRAALLGALQPEIDKLIEQRLQESLAPLAERLLAGLRGDLQLIVRDALSAAIHAAVERQLERRKSDG